MHEDAGREAFTIKDSGERKQFASGMVRDTTTGKLDWWRLLVGPMARRLVAHVTKGASKYPDVKPGVPNWTLAEGPEEYQRFKDSAFRHFIQWYMDERDEDHAAAVLFNINGAEYVRDRMPKMLVADQLPKQRPQMWDVPKLSTIQLKQSD